MTIIKKCFAMGGGGFSMREDSKCGPLDFYLLNLVAKNKPKICFLPTASGDSEDYGHRFINAFKEFSQPSVLYLFRREITDLENFILNQDIIYVGGGNTINMLAIWQAHGLDKILIKAYQKGILMCGLSAGAICWFSGGITDSFGTQMAVMGGKTQHSAGLQLHEFSFCPHWDGEPERQEKYIQAIESNVLPQGFALSDFAGAYFENGVFKELVVSKKEAIGLKISTGAKIVEIPSKFIHFKKL